MRVLLVNHTAVISGAERSLLDLLENLPPEVEATTFCPAGELAEQLAARGFRWERLPAVEASLKLDPRFTPLGILAALKAAARLRPVLAEYDVVHANSIRAGVVCALAGGRRALMVHLRDCLPPRRVSRWTARWLASRADTIVANSVYTADCLRSAASIPDLDAEIIHGPLDLRRLLAVTETRDEARQALGFGGDDALLGIVGQITPWKGQDRAIELLAALRRDHPDARLVVVGSPRFTSGATRYDNRSYARQLERLVARLGLGDAVMFLGEREDVPLVMRALDVLLVPSREEPFGRVVVEAMAAGRPVVATDRGGPAEVVHHGEDGYLVPPFDVEAWRRTVDPLLRDEELREGIGRRARERAERDFGASVSVDALIALWRSRSTSSAEREALRVLFLSHTGDRSGAENAMMRLLEAIPKEHTRAVACPPGGPLEEAIKDRGLRQFPIPGTNVSLRLRPVPTAAGLVRLVRSGIGLRRIARRFRADVVHANTVRAGLIAAVTRRLGGPPVVVQCHDHLPKTRVSKLARVVIAREADVVIGVTNHTAQEFNAGLRHPKAECVHISIDHARFSPAARGRSNIRAELSLPEDAHLLVEVAQITPWKGQDTAIRALAEIRRQMDAHLLIIGDIAFASGHYDNVGFHEALQGLVRELELESAVHFLGRRSDVPQLMGIADMLLLPSWDEPFGTVVAEAMAVGTPVVVTSQGGLSDYVTDGVNGRLLPPHDPALWAEVVLELLRDPEGLARIGEANVRAVARFTDERYSERMVSAYRRACVNGSSLRSG
jgi:glycosyltransferase involved in cell wall biosynthesis